MRRTALAVVVLVGCCAGSARADTLPAFEGIADNFTFNPDGQFQFTLRAPELIGLTGYQIELVFQAAGPNPLVAGPSFVSPDGTSYVFGDPGSAGFALNTPGGSEVRLTITDLDNPQGPADITPGVNDFLATVVVTPNGLTGPLTISVSDNTIFVLQEGGEVRGSGSVSGSSSQSGDGNPVPAPPAVLLLGIGGMLLGARSRFLRRAA